jgi:hypothetical protein
VIVSVRHVLATLLVGVAVLASRSAGAYVRARASGTSSPVSWPNPAVMLEVTRPADGFSIAADDFRAEAAAAVAAWSYPALACTAVSLTVAPGFAANDEVAFDGHNRIITRTGDWPHDRSQVALTTVFSRSRPGALADEIIEADIELNDADWDWAIIPDPDGTTLGQHVAMAFDVRSALTHEVGHFIGLAHDCLQAGDATALDNAGNEPPACASIPAAEAPQILGATMYAFMNPGDVNWRSLSDDDARAACDIYPRESVPMVLGSCGVAASREGAVSPIEDLALFAGLAALGLTCRARRSRRARVRGRSA